MQERARGYHVESDRLDRYVRRYAERKLYVEPLVDPAFKDRADIVKYVGLPPKDGIYWILRGCLIEMMDRKLIARDVVRNAYPCLNGRLTTMRRNS
jgi:hypothetical protein